MIIVAGHVCLDIIPQFPAQASLDPGTLVRVGAATLSTGGVSNVGVALHRLGTPVKLIHKVGDDLFGDAIKSILVGLSPELASGVQTVAGETTSYSVVIAPPGVDRMFIHCPGANDTFNADDVRDDAFAGAKHLHFGYPPIMRAIYSDGGESCARLLRRAKQAGLSTSLDMCSLDSTSDAGQVDWLAWLKKVLPEVDYFLPSIDEIASMLRIGIPTEYFDIVELLSRLCDMGPCFTMLKMGDRGLIAYEKKLRIVTTQPCYDIDVISTNGSGDCTIAGFLSAIINDEEYFDHAMMFASACGSFACQAMDANSGVPNRHKVWERVAQKLSMLPTIESP